MSKYTINEYENWEPGSNKKVLRNKLKIKSELEMQKMETIALKNIYSNAIVWGKFDYDHQFTSNDLLDLHER